MAIDAGSVKASLSLDISSFSTGIQSAKNQLQSISEVASATAVNMKTAGQFMGAGLTQGILSNISAARQAGAALAKAAEEGAKTAAQIHSPSRVFMEIGQYIDEGLALGIYENKYMAVNEMGAVANALLDTGNEISTGLISINRYTGEVIFDCAYEALMTKTELYLTERDLRIMNITEGTDETIRQIERETQATEDAYDIKMKLYEQEMFAKLSIIDTSSNGQIADLKAQLAEIDRLNDEERKKEAARRYEEQLAAKELALLNAKTEEEAARIIAQINELKRNREKALLQEERREQQAAIRDEIAQIQQQAKEDKQALKEEYEAKKYQLKLKQEAEVTYLKEMQKRLAEDAKLRKELEETQTKIVKAQAKKRSEDEVIELRAREKELLISIENNRLSLTAFTSDVEKIGKDYGTKLIAGFKSSEDELVTYLQWIARQAEKAGKAVADAKKGKTSAATSLKESLADGYSRNFAPANYVQPKTRASTLGMPSQSYYQATAEVYSIEPKKQKLDLEIDYDKLSQAITKSIKPSISMENHFTSPKALSEVETRRQQELLLRDLAFRI